MKIVGKVLWWDEKYKRGVIVDDSRNEYYFDSSVLQGSITNLKSNKLVVFEIDESITHTRCAKFVGVPTQKQASAAAKKTRAEASI